MSRPPRWREDLGVHLAPRRQLPLDDLVWCYNEPHRFYHDLGHVAHCQQELRGSSGAGMLPLYLALCAHDANYRAGGQDDVGKSATYGEGICARLDLNAIAAEVGDLIRITDHATEPKDGAQRLILDIDLSIFGQEWRLVDEYDAGIRAEYA